MRLLIPLSGTNTPSPTPLPPIAGFLLVTLGETEAETSWADCPRHWDIEGFLLSGMSSSHLPSSESDSRAGQLWGTCREHVPELTARGLLKIALSGTVKWWCLVPERGEGRARRVSQEGDAATLSPVPPALGPHPEGPQGPPGSRSQRMSSQGLPVRAADTVQRCQAAELGWKPGARYLAWRF